MTSAARSSQPKDAGSSRAANPMEPRAEGEALEDANGAQACESGVRT
eukprot:CAMPEP_0115248464 /NCGR_PEP_ID=MMETSP0270-20121206/42083_1 /TAXON_ID=71861 /ORGANISM="Scrippsiella trochoidea, Strain CCMP3099" /LENGTH=46 /DNA_ID= /DNA_START= /DNA_END= /DNA_ORIENTATION=